MATLAQAQAKIRAWIIQPRLFVEEALGIDGLAGRPHISRQQADGLEMYRRILTAKIKRHEGAPMSDQEKSDANKLGLSIMSGQGTGKDGFLAWVILHFHFCLYMSTVLCTAPAGPQLRIVLWAEIYKWLSQSHLTEDIVHQSDVIFHKDYGRKKWFVVPRTIKESADPKTQAETLAGLHEDYMLYAIDEASGVADPVFGPIEGSMTGFCNFAIVIFNPTRSTGYAIETQTKRREDWLCLHWSSEESELVPKEVLERDKRHYGEDSNYYRVRRKGLPPHADEDALIPWDVAMDAIGRDIIPSPDDTLGIGVDVSRGGDDETIILPVRGHRVDVAKRPDGTFEAIPSHRGYDGIQVANWTQWEVQRLLAEQDATRYAVAIDVIGVGASVYDHMKRYSGLRNVFGVNVAELPSNQERFHRLRDQVLWELREEFLARTNSIPNDSQLLAELTTVKWEPVNGKIKVEGKKEMRARGLASPNKLDAYALALYARKLLGHPGSAGMSPRRRLQTAASWRTR